MKSEEYYLKICETLAQAAAEKGNSPVGALLLQGDQIISQAAEASFSKNDITCHAEIEAIRAALNQLKTHVLTNCILFTTHEPCIMCSYVIRFYRIQKVIFRHKVSWLGGFSSSMPLLNSKQVPPHWSAPPEIKHLSLASIFNNKLNHHGK